MSPAIESVSAPVVWRGWRHWESAELLCSSEDLGRMHREIRSRGEALTRHYNPAEDLTALVRWTWGASDYTALESRADFLRESPGEAGLFEYFAGRGRRVECALARIDQRLREEAAEAGPTDAFRRRVFELLGKLRERCSLGGGYLVQLDRYLLEHLERLALFDRHLGLARETAAPRAPSGAYSAELAGFDRRMEAWRSGARSL
ncbi:MAG: hypothetical protein HY303_12000 [Candidatus Wallbacteria bacterium]|nr:hypothetical protein [Candidatus Wallbacteria bacterium]